MPIRSVSTTDAVARTPGIHKPTIGCRPSCCSIPADLLSFHAYGGQAPCARSSGDRAFGCGPKGRRFESCRAYICKPRAFFARGFFVWCKPERIGILRGGEVSEWFKVLLSKSSEVSKPPRVRIPPSPPQPNARRSWKGRIVWPSARDWKSRRRDLSPRGFESHPFRPPTIISLPVLWSPATYTYRDICKTWRCISPLSTRGC